MAKHMKRWLWAGAMAGTLALGTACSSTESKVLVAQADTSTTQPGTGGAGTTTPNNPTPSTTDPNAAQNAPQNPGTVPATPSQNPGSNPPSGEPIMPGDTSATSPGTTTGDAGIGGASDAGTGGSGVAPVPVVPDDTSGTFQPPSGGAVLDAGTF
ncbi:Erp protein [Myxococcus stipitatus]|uniref:Erp protein n=1 Tax=Myxococcus stipitatus TaxID=83455 RepID=UPI0030D04C8F